MLKELKNISQENNGIHRRWFSDFYFDLIVWFDSDDAYFGFQLCYNKDRDEHAFTWRRDRGFQHNRIDSGDDSPLKNETPILLPDGVVKIRSLRERFKKESQALEPDLAEFIDRKLKEYEEVGSRIGI